MVSKSQVDTLYSRVEDALHGTDLFGDVLKPKSSGETEDLWYCMLSRTYPLVELWHKQAEQFLVCTEMHDVPEYFSHTGTNVEPVGIKFDTLDAALAYITMTVEPSRSVRAGTPI